MMVRSHVVIGIAAWVVAAPLLRLPAFGPGTLLAATLGAVLPDIDHPGSWVGRRTRPLSTALSALLGHRGVTHSAVALAGLALLAAHSPGVWHGAAVALMVGYLSHLAADALTPAGLPLTWPLRQRWGVGLCRTGSAMEAFVVALLAGAAVWRVARHGLHQ